jgi:hypothetical protein
LLRHHTTTPQEELRLREAEDDARIAQYLAVKEAREAALAAEKEAAAHEKEMEVARLRAQQERAIDRQGEVDELRARRWALLVEWLDGRDRLPATSRWCWCPCSDLRRSYTDRRSHRCH